MNRYIAFRYLWPRVLEQYTISDLTYQSDKLAGIKGVTELIGKAIGWQNCQGLWLDILGIDMAWKSNIADGPEEPEKGGRAGNGALSWTWVSVRQSVTYAMDLGKYAMVPPALYVPDIFGYPNPGGVAAVNVEGLPRTVIDVLEGRPHNSVSLMTDLRKVWVIYAKGRWSRSNTALLTLQEPTYKQVWEEITVQEMDETDMFMQEWEWTLDVPLDKSLTTAWFANLIDVESQDGRRAGVIGLIVKGVDLPRRVFERIRILKRTMLKSEGLSSISKANESRTLVLGRGSPGRNPFAAREGPVSLVHII